MTLPPDIVLREQGCTPLALAGTEALLSPDEHARLVQMTHAGRRHAFVAGRVAARLLLAEQLGLPPAAVPLHVAPDGAVEVPGTGLFLSIAHAGTRAVAAVAPRPLGVDLEPIRSRHPGLQQFLLHPGEYAALDALPYDPVRRLLLYWVLKEATLKALRTGLRLSPKHLTLAVDPSRCTAHIAVEGAAPWQASYEESDGYFLAVAFPD